MNRTVIKAKGSQVFPRKYPIKAKKIFPITRLWFTAGRGDISTTLPFSISSRISSWDRGYKKDLYEKSGVREYWLVEPETQTVEVYLLKDKKFVLDDGITRSFSDK